MNKSLVIIVVLVAISVLGIVLSQGYLFGVNLQPVSLARIAPPTCITPPAYPQLIMQSGNICSGTYNYGIGIGTSNIKVKCLGSTFFGATSSPGLNGLLINGSYTNITVEDCNFNLFPENGILLRGRSGMSSPGNLSKVLLKNVTAFGNVRDGLQIRENTYQIDTLGGKYDFNGENGIHLISEYKDPLRYNVNPDIYPKYFPNDVRVFSSYLSDNYKNGVHVDGEKYYRQLADVQRENNTLIFDGNIIENNGENGIKNTDFALHTNLFFNYGNYFVARNNISNNALAGIKINTKMTQGPLGNEINCAPSFGEISFSNIDYIFLNLIEQNKNGIEITVDSVAVPNSSLSCGGYGTSYSASSVMNYANRIRYNKESGVLHQVKNPLLVGPSSDFGTYIRGRYIQNIISFNNNSGVFFNGSASTAAMTQRLSLAQLECNDIIKNKDYGVRATGSNNLSLKEYAVSLQLMNSNILENNSIGGVYNNFSTQFPYSSLSAYNSYIGPHLLFGLYNGVFNLSSGPTYNEIKANDFVGSPLLAFDRDNKLHFRQNYWSDYSPGCLDSQPDGWCDVNRPIPLANQDIQPKAGVPWGYNARGYLQLDQGILLSSCSVGIPTYPPRPIIPPTGGTTGGVESYKPDATGGGPGGSPGTGSDGTTGGGLGKGK